MIAVKIVVKLIDDKKSLITYVCNVSPENEIFFFGLLTHFNTFVDYFIICPDISGFREFFIMFLCIKSHEIPSGKYQE